MSLNYEEMAGPAVPTHGSTTLEGRQASTTLEVVPPMTLNLKGEEMPAPATTLEGSDSDATVSPMALNCEEMAAIPAALKDIVASAVTTHACTTLEGWHASTTLQVVTPTTLNLKGEDMPAHATTMDAAAAACPTNKAGYKAG